MLDLEAFEGPAREIALAENARCRAYLEADIATLDVLLGDELVYVHSTGRVDTKADRIALTQSLNPLYQSFRHRNVMIHAGLDWGYLRGNIAFDATKDGENRTYDTLVLLVWVRRPSGWQLVSYNGTARAQ